MPHGSISLLLKHVYLVEEYQEKNFREKILWPGKQDIGNVSEKALTDNNSGSLAFSKSKQSGCRRRKNPAKTSLERHGIEFPSNRHACSSHSAEKLSSQVLYTAPRNKGKEAEQLAMFIRGKAFSWNSLQAKIASTQVTLTTSCHLHTQQFFLRASMSLLLRAMGYPPTSVYSM